MAKNLIEKITAKQINPNVPEFRVGDTVCVDCKIIEEKGGKSIAIYPKGKKDKVYPLFEDERVNYICRGDYSVNSDLDKIVKLIITQVSILETLINKESELLKK